MSIENTEIPALRSYLQILPARLIFTYFRSHCKQRIPSVLNSVELSCALDGAERRKAWAVYVDSAQELPLPPTIYTPSIDLV